MTKVDETLETAVPQEYVITVRTKNGIAANRAYYNVHVVKALSIRNAKLKVLSQLKKTRKGMYKKSTLADWVFETIERAGYEEPT